jgi:N-acetylglucosaminyl-diphospho-decaprenol L-rhamnosyltransferase
VTRGGAEDAEAAVDDPAGRTAAVVINYESGPSLACCVTDLHAVGLRELVVVDNGSGDGSLSAALDAVPGLGVIDPGRNLGYGAAANRGVAATTAPYVLVCNSDLEVPVDAVAALVAALESDPGCALAGPLVRTQAGGRYPSARTFPTLVDAAGHALLGLFVPDNRFTRSYQKSELDTAAVEVRTVDWVSGACFLVRREAFEAVGGFDESYFMYAEDVDLCWRLCGAGWTVAYAPTAEVTHLQGRSTNRHPYRMILEHHRSLLRFASRSSTGGRRLLLPLVAIGIAVRATLACLARARGVVGGDEGPAAGGADRTL